jgi:hypothetical protein
MTLLKIKRGTASQLASAITAQTLNQAEPYLITDEGRIAIGTSNNTFVKMARLDEVQALDADLTAISSLTGTGFLKRTGADTWTLDTNTYLTGNETITLTGDATGTGATSIAITLANTGITAGTYTKVTIDSKGRATAGTTLSASDIPTLAASKISDFDTQVRTNRLDQMTAPNASVSFNSQNITGLADPVNAQDAATKNYVDSAVQGISPKDSVRVATTANITLSGTQTIDGIAVIAGDRVLVKNQDTAHQNGIYVVSASAWDRAADANTWNELISAFAFVEQGTLNGDNGYLITVNVGGTLGVSDVTVSQFSGAGQVIAGAGLTKSGNQLDVVGTTNRIVVYGDSVDIDSAYVGQTSIVTLGTVATGTWNATTIATTKGGTGLTSYVAGDIIYASGTNTLAALPVQAEGQVLQLVGGVPAWGDIDGGTF